MTNKQKSNNGFTLIELLVVISIIGLLAAVGLTVYTSTMARARYSKVQADLTAIRTAGHNYYTQHNIYPYDRPPGAISVAWDPPSGFLVPDFLNEWPEPPCAGWKYDWDDWIRDSVHNVTNAENANGDANQIVRITVQDTAHVNKYYYCIYDENPGGNGPCLETGETITEFSQITNNQLTCD